MQQFSPFYMHDKSRYGIILDALDTLFIMVNYVCHLLMLSPSTHSHTMDLKKKKQKQRRELIAIED